MKQKIISLMLLLTLFLAVAFPTVSAYMVKQTEKIENMIEPAQVSCKVNENFNGTNKTSVTVTNTSNIEAYIRVRVVSYWQDSKGNTVAKSSVMPEFTVSDAWIKDEANDTYYCKEPIAAGTQTPEFLKDGASIALNRVVESYQNVDYVYHQVVEIFAEAIQSKPEEAVENSWKVTVTDRKITSVN